MGSLVSFPPRICLIYDYQYIKFKTPFVRLLAFYNTLINNHKRVSHLSLTFCCHKRFFYPTQIIRFFLIAKWQKAAACAGRLRTSILVRFSRYVSFAVYLDCVL